MVVGVPPLALNVCVNDPDPLVQETDAANVVELPGLTYCALRAGVPLWTSYVILREVILKLSLCVDPVSAGEYVDVAEPRKNACFK